MLTFGDYDLKRLKDQITKKNWGNACVEMDCDELRALLARLEAAELCAEHGKLLAAYLSAKKHDEFEQGALEVWERRKESWRKAAGKNK